MMRQGTESACCLVDVADLYVFELTCQTFRLSACIRLPPKAAKSNTLVTPAAGSSVSDRVRGDALDPWQGQGLDAVLRSPAAIPSGG